MTEIKRTILEMRLIQSTNHIWCTSVNQLVKESFQITTDTLTACIRQTWQEQQEGVTEIQ